MTPDRNSRLESVVIAPGVTIREAIARLDQAGTGALVVCAEDRKPQGLITDGDIRRALLRACDLEDPCSTIANRNFVFSSGPVLALEALRLMNLHDIHQLPVLNDQGAMIDFLLRKDLGAEEDLSARSKLRLESVIISPSATISQAISQLDAAGTGALILCTEGRKLFGLLSDGDIRRAVLRRVSMDERCETISTRNPTTTRASISTMIALHVMNERDINHLPVVDDDNNVVDFLLRRDIVSEEQLGMSAVVMAGGFGKRLFPLTEHVPKPMLPVGDRPLLERTIEQLRRSGIHEVNLTTHYLPEAIEQHFGDGKSFGVRLNYVKEDHPLGTAGGLKLLKNPTGPILVMNGDILTGLPFQEMLSFHRKSGADITVAVRKYEVQVPFGVVECDDVRISSLQEKPSLVFFINAGIYLLQPEVRDAIPEGQKFDMTDLIQKLLDAGRPVVSFPIMEYWLDVGRHEDYKRANDDIRDGKIRA